MQEIVIVWGVIAWLVCWLIDLFFFCILGWMQGALMLDPLLKLLVISLALFMIAYYHDKQVGSEHK